MVEKGSGLAADKEEWAEVLESFKAGNLADAVSISNSVRGKAVRATEVLGLPVTAGAKS